MFLHYTRVNRFCFACLCLCVLLHASQIAYSVAVAKSEPVYVHHIRNIETAPLGIINPVGLTFSPKGHDFQVISSRQLTSTATDLVQLTPVEQVKGTKRIAAKIDDPINVTFDGKYNRLLILRAQANQLLIVQADSAGTLDPKSLRNSKVRAAGLQKPQGLTVDPATGVLYILDAVGPRLVQVSPDAIGDFEHATITSSDLSGAALSTPRGVAWHPGTGHLYLFSPTSQILTEVTPTGQVVSQRDLATFGLSNTQALVFAPSGDLTDDPATFSLYIADAGLSTSAQSSTEPSSTELVCTTPDACPNTLYLPLIADSSANDVTGDVADGVTDGVVDGSEESVAIAEEARSSAVPANAGTIVEVSLAAPIATAASTFTSALVRTVSLATIAPASPDPSGLAYLPNSNTLLLSDGEVEETVAGITHFQGANIWELTLGGSVVRTANVSKVLPSVVRMTNEPTGTAWNPNNGHSYISDDDGRRIYDLNPGTDNLIGTADDTWTFFDTLAAGNSDPEGVTFDPINNQIIVADGLNMEIYRYTTSGVFLGQFDVAQYGVLDPESVEYNPGSGTLFILSNHTSRIIIETTLAGALLNTFDITAAAAYTPAGLAYAPASDGSGFKRFYVVDRQIDNDVDPNIVDGKLYELTAPQPTVNTAPFVNAGLDQTITQPSAALLDATVTDDGLPLPSTLLTTWSQLSGPDAVTFGNTSAVDTTVGFPTAGVYTLRLTASDGALSSSDDVIITVNPSTGSNAAPTVNAGLDQTITLPNAALLDATVTDDGLPTPPSLTVIWTKFSGPGTVTFGNLNAIDTTATFSVAGIYTLRLIASDGALSVSDDVIITVNTGDIIFADGFETGTLAAWSSSTNGANLSVSTLAALAGSTRGLRVAITSNTSTFLTDLTPTTEPRYRARFYFDPNSIIMSGGEAHYLFYGISSTSTVATYIEFRRSSGQYQLRAAILNDASTYSITTWNTISDAPHSIEIDWRRSTAAGANNGGVTFWIDNLQRANITGIDNDTRRIDSIRLGAVAGIDSGTRGATFFDAFVSTRQTFIGP